MTVDARVEVEAPPSRSASLLLALLERVLTRMVNDHPAVAQMLEAHDGRLVQCSSQAPPMDICIRLGRQPQLAFGCAASADARLEGTLAGLLGLLWRSDPLEQLQAHGVCLSGDRALAGQLFVCLARLAPDPEEDLARYTGGVTAHLIMSAVRRSRAGLHETLVSVCDWLPDYLQEELQVLPPSGAVEAFVEDLQALDVRQAALAARIAQLDTRLEATGSGQGPEK